MRGEEKKEENWLEFLEEEEMRKNGSNYQERERERERMQWKL